jgi:hypothetical protein
MISSCIISGSGLGGAFFGLAAAGLAAGVASAAASFFSPSASFFSVTASAIQYKPKNQEHPFRHPTFPSFTQQRLT